MRLLTTKAPRLGLAVVVCLGLVVDLRLGLVAVALCLGLVVVAPCLGQVVVVAASSPFRVRRGMTAVALGLAVYRRRRGVPRVGTLCCACRPRTSKRGCRRGRG